MKGKSVLLVNLVLLVVLFATPSLVAAAPPAPPDLTAVPAPPGAAPPPDPAQLNLPAPAGIQAATELRNSLTDAQRAAVGEVLQKYAPELEAISKSLRAPEAANLALPSAAGRPPVPSRAQRLEMVKGIRTTQKVTKQLADVQAKIDEELKTILTPEQWAKNQAILSSLKTIAEPPATPAVPPADVSPKYNSTYCYNAGYYGSWTAYFAYWAYYYAYWNYYYHATTYGYYAYVDLYYARVYALSGLPRSGGGYFDLVALGSDSNGLLGYAISDWNNAYYYALYGYQYAYSDFLNTNQTYAYYAYYYGYYAYYYGYYTYLYAYYCYYG